MANDIRFDGPAGYLAAYRDGDAPAGVTFKPVVAWADTSSGLTACVLDEDRGIILSCNNGYGDFIGLYRDEDRSVAEEKVAQLIRYEDEKEREQEVAKIREGLKARLKEARLCSPNGALREDVNEALFTGRQFASAYGDFFGRGTIHQPPFKVVMNLFKAWAWSFDPTAATRDAIPPREP